MAKSEVFFTEEAGEDLDRVKKYHARQITSCIEEILEHRPGEVTRSSVKKLKASKVFTV